MPIAKRRQAGAEIEIAPQIIKAGLDAIDEFDSDELATESEMIVRQVYTAMRKAERELGHQVFVVDR